MRRTALLLLTLTCTGALYGEQAALPRLCGTCSRTCQLRGPCVAFSPRASHGPSLSTSLSRFSCLAHCASVGTSLSHLPFRNHFCVYPASESLPLPAPSLMPVLCNSPEALRGCRLRLLSLGTNSLVTPTGLLMPFVTSPLPLVSRCSSICLQWDPSPALYPAQQRSSAP